MSFWGIEVKPGKPVLHSFERTLGRLRISQATLGIGNATKKSLVQCNVGNKTPVFLCALLPDKTESCHLDLEFEEEDSVVFSVLGPRSVHLTGYYLSKSSRTYADSETESYGEDIANTDTEVSNQCSDDDEYEDSFINDDDDDEPDVFSPSPVPSDEDGDVVGNRKGNCKRLRKKRQVIMSEDEDTSQESGDEDKYILSASKNKVEAKETSPEGGEGSDKVTDELTGQAENGDSGKEEKVDTVDTTNVSNICKDQLVSDKGDHKLEPECAAESAKTAKRSKKRKNKFDDAKSIEVGISGQENMSVDDKTEQLTESDVMHEVPIGIEPRADERSENGPKLKKRKKRSEGERLNECKDSSPSDDLKEVKQDAEGTDISKDLPATTGENKLQTNTQSININSGVADGFLSEKKHEKKKKKKTKVEDEGTNIMPEPDMPVNENFVIALDKVPNVESSRVRTLSNGLTIEDLSMGEADGKVATPGRKVKFYYTGMLRENGQVFDSNIGKTPYKFRLGDKQIIDGWNIGLEGMRVGDKRRLTIPPSMGYGSKGGGENIPPNSWLVYEIELVAVRR
ncbi:PREDICTED: peptidyl-prolyl cis-trans isomerase FKBP53-like [Ipomoea nil]|uniref:peptidyl-prolyl cis-trans isomerase FKBP53-like n=1 Tax=Ipomoea nil TaxID=35883 RepID=UPI000901F850|nr:PREDICTED: peptidyl-prolyl cis-trans isomerase FKBP53-like [Ipomoea nil]